MNNKFSKNVTASAKSVFEYEYVCDCHQNVVITCLTVHFLYDWLTNLAEFGNV